MSAGTGARPPMAEIAARLAVAMALVAVCGAGDAVWLAVPLVALAMVATRRGLAVLVVAATAGALAGAMLAPFPALPLFTAAGALAVAMHARGDRASAWETLLRGAAGWAHGLMALAFLPLAAGVLFEGPPLWLAAAWAVVYLVAWWQCIPAKPTPPHGAFWGNMAVATVSALVALAVLEGGARLLETPADATDPTAFFAPHDEAVFTLRPGFEGNIYYAAGENQRAPMPVRVSEQGLRDRVYGPRTPGGLRVLLLGDSFAMGWGLPLEQALPRQLERALAARLDVTHVEVVNGGVGMYSPWQERIFLEERCMPLEPDIVVLQLFPANDIPDTLLRVPAHAASYDTFNALFFRRMTRLDQWPTRLHDRLLVKSSAYRMATRRLMSPETLPRLLERTRLFPGQPAPPLPPNAQRPFYTEVLLRDYYPALERAWLLVEADVAGIAAYCRAREVPLAAFAIPEMTSAIPKAWRHATRQLDPEAYEPFKDTRLANAMLARLQIPVVPVDDIIRTHPDPASLYLPFDGHLSAAGTSLVATRIAEWLTTTMPSAMQTGGEAP